MDSLDVSIRDINESDIPFILKYWFHSPPGYLEAMGVDLKKMPTEESFKTALFDKISINDHLPDSKLNALVIEYHGQPVGFHTVNPIIEGDYGIFHAHIWDPELRGKGIATKSYLLACGEFMRRFELTKIIFKTPLQNSAAIKVKEKLGIRKLGQEEVNFGIIRDGTLAQVFEISSEELPVLLEKKDLR